METVKGLFAAIAVVFVVILLFLVKFLWIIIFPILAAIALGVLTFAHIKNKGNS